jgi:hypothetical protein
MGESFSNAVVRTHPELGPIGVRGGAPIGARSTLMPAPGRTFGAPSSFGSVPVGRGGYAPGIVNRGNAGGGGFHGGAPSGGGGFHSAPSGGNMGGGGAHAAAPAAAPSGGGGGGAHH